MEKTILKDFNFENLRTISGCAYRKEEEQEIKLSFLRDFLCVTDLKTGIKYGFGTGDESGKTFFIINVLQKENIKTVSELLEYCKEKADFTKEIVLKNILNPFFKVGTGKLEIKVKNGRLTKTQVKKILKHEDTEITRHSVYTDDYLLDAQRNYQEGIKLDRLDFLEEVINFFDFCSLSDKDIKTGKIFISTVGHSHTTIITNKNLVFIN